jgi:ribonuclease HII
MPRSKKLTKLAQRKDELFAKLLQAAVRVEMDAYQNHSVDYRDASMRWLAIQTKACQDFMLEEQSVILQAVSDGIKKERARASSKQAG